MTWTYSRNPGCSTLNEVRFLIGDTNENDQQLQDEEINYILGKETNVTMAAAAAAEIIGAQYSREADLKIGDYSISASQKAKAYFDLAKKLKDSILGAAKFKCIPYAGGISQSDKEVDAMNSDLVQPKFTRNMMEFTSDTGTMDSTGDDVDD